MEINFEYKEMLKPKSSFAESKFRWYAQEQLGALKYYLKPAAKVIKEYKENGWQGNCFALIEYKNAYVLWRDYFGSCSGCDALDGCSIKRGYDYIESTMTEGNCKRFKSVKNMESWLLNTDDYLWEALKNNYSKFKGGD